MATKRAKRQQPVLKLKVKGPAIGQGRIPIPELVGICLQVQAAINRQAEAREGVQTLRSGPVLSKVKEECTLELLGIDKGSAVLRFGLAKPQLPLPYSDLPPGNAVIAEVAAAVKSLGNGNRLSIDSGVLESLNDLGSVLDQGAVSEIEFIVPQRGKKRRIVAKFNDRTRKRHTRQPQDRNLASSSKIRRNTRITTTKQA
jgi:hypothetical protein